MIISEVDFFEFTHQLVENFEKFYWKAWRFMLNETTGVDGYRKLKSAFPVDEDDVITVKRCLCELIQLISKVENAEKALIEASGFTQSANGGYISNKISSTSSGSESISYASNSAPTNPFDAAVANQNDRIRLYRSVVTEYLSGVPDVNGINLLFLGPYPYV